MEMPNFEEKDPRIELKRSFLKDAERVLGDLYDEMEIDDILSYLGDDDIEKWSKELYTLTERIDAQR